MKINFIPQTLAIFAMSFLAWSCASNPHVDSARSALAESDYEKVLESAESAIETNPEDGDGYFYKGIAYAYISQEKEVSERKEDYRNSRESFDVAKIKYDTQESENPEASELQGIILELWGYEYNSGIELLTDDIVSSHEDSLTIARHHFINASIINPDSVQSFNLMAEVNFALGNMDEAEEVTRHIIYDMDKADEFNYFRLAYYLIDNERDEEALKVLQEARDKFPEEIDFIQEIANAHFRMGNNDQALAVVEELMERDPDNADYRLVYATQIYQMVEDLDSRIRDLHDEMYDMSQAIRNRARESGANQSEIEQMLAEVDKKEAEANSLIEESFKYSDQAEEQLLIALKSNSENAEVHSTLGIVYQNRAAVLHDQRNMTDNIEEANEYDRQAREFLEKALPHYEKAAELEPNNTEHWRSLFRVYTNLGMEEEAKEAQEKAGL